MSSILNSVSSGDLQVRQVPRVQPVKEDSIVNLLQNSEIEFKVCPKINNDIVNFITGFGENNDLHYEDECRQHVLKTPLYRENCLGEFISEEEKAAARHALGLYNKGDVVAMSLLTAEQVIPSQQEWNDMTIQQMRKGDRFFAPVTSFKAVYDSNGTTLDVRIKGMQTIITQQQKDIAQINQVSKSDKILSLGDVRAFLHGFNNGDDLHNTLDVMNQEMLRFEKSGQIIV